jgi:hypothetical protein
MKIDKLILKDKCDWFYSDNPCCPNPIFFGRFFYNDFGNKILSVWCKDCFKLPDPINTLRNIDWLVESNKYLEIPPPKRSLEEGEFFESYTLKEGILLSESWKSYLETVGDENR